MQEPATFPVDPAAPRTVHTAPAAAPVPRYSAWGTDRWLACCSLYALVIGVAFFNAGVSRFIWLDEIFTLYQVQDRTWHEFVDSMQAGINALPYGYFALMWGVDQISPLNSVTLRLPSALLAVATLAGLHRMLAPRFGHGPALFACAGVLLLTPEFVTFAIDARPYALYVAVALAALWAWLLVAEGQWRGRAALATAVVCGFALPAAHYVGVFYSAALVAAYWAVQPRGARIRAIPLAVATAAGWAVFAAVHWSVMSVTLEGRGLLDARWVPRTWFSDAFQAVILAVTPPAVAGAVLLAFLGAAAVGLPRHLVVRARPVAHPTTAGYLFVASLLFLLVPVALFVLAALGGEKLTLRRYFGPSLLAQGVIAALLLASFEVRWRGRGLPLRLPPALVWRLRRPRDLIAAGATVALLAFPVAVNVRDAVRGPTLEMRDKIPVHRYVPASGPPWVTDSLIAAFEFSYYRGTRPPMYLLVQRPDQAQLYARFNRDFPAVSLDGLNVLPEFVYARWPFKMSGAPEFDIVGWALRNGYAIEQVGNLVNATDGPIYALRRRVAPVPVAPALVAPSAADRTASSTGRRP